MSDTRLAMVFWEGDWDGASVALVRAMEQWMGGGMPTSEGAPEEVEETEVPEAPEVPEEAEEEAGEETAAEEEEDDAEEDAGEEEAEEDAEEGRRSRRGRVTADEVERMVEQRDGGMSVAEIAEEVGRCAETVVRALRRHDEEAEAGATETDEEDAAEEPEEEPEEEEEGEDVEDGEEEAKPPVPSKGPITRADVERWVQQRRNGATVTAIAQEAGRDKSVVYHYINLFERHKI